MPNHSSYQTSRVIYALGFLLSGGFMGQGCAEELSRSRTAGDSAISLLDGGQPPLQLVDSAIKEDTQGLLADAGAARTDSKPSKQDTGTPKQDTGTPKQDKGAPKKDLGKDTSTPKPDGPATTCGFSTSDPKCNTCILSNCNSQCSACSSNSQCVSLFNCIKGCSNQSCVDQCANTYSGGINDYVAFIGADGCYHTHCASICSGGTTPDAGAPKQDTGGSTDPFETARINCVNLINQYRAKVGAPALQRNKARESCADAQAKADAAHNQAHWAYMNLSPNCVVYPPTDRQNECPAWYGPAETGIQSCLSKMYAEGYSGSSLGNHHDVMIYSGYKSVSCGYYVVNSNNVWMVQNYY